MQKYSSTADEVDNSTKRNSKAAAAAGFKLYRV